jgi:hypothetical protein
VSRIPRYAVGLLVAVGVIGLGCGMCASGYFGLGAGDENLTRRLKEKKLGR